MEKQEFLDRLRLALNGKVAPEIVADTIEYYENYINTELRQGKNSTEVMAMLGDPRLIARTIVDTKGNAGGGYEEADNYKEYDNTRSATQEEYDYDEGKRSFGNFRNIQLKSGIWLVLILAILIFLICVAFKILFAIWPVLVIAGLVVYFVKFFRGE